MERNCKAFGLSSDALGGECETFVSTEGEFGKEIEREFGERIWKEVEREFERNLEGNRAGI